MSNIDKISLITNEIRILTGIDTDVLVSNNHQYQFITGRRYSRIVDVRNIKSFNDIILYSRLVSLDLTKPA